MFRISQFCSRRGSIYATRLCHAVELSWSCTVVTVCLPQEFTVLVEIAAGCASRCPG